MHAWPATVEDLAVEQERLARVCPAPWRPGASPLLLGGCFICFGGSAGASPGAREPAWAGAALWRQGRLLRRVVVQGRAGHAYEAGALALREGPLLQAVVAALGQLPDLLMVNATGRDHPRRAGLAVHLGALLRVPTIGVTERPLVAWGDLPGGERGARSPLVLGGEVVGYWVRTRSSVRPVAAHAGWRVDPEAAAAIVLSCTGRARTPEPLRWARRSARTARAASRA